jgi:hypothetical protein
MTVSARVEEWKVGCGLLAPDRTGHSSNRHNATDLHRRETDMKRPTRVETTTILGSGGFPLPKPVKKVASKSKKVAPKKGRAK